MLQQSSLRSCHILICFRRFSKRCFHIRQHHGCSSAPYDPPQQAASLCFALLLYEGETTKTCSQDQDRFLSTSSIQRLDAKALSSRTLSDSTSSELPDPSKPCRMTLALMLLCKCFNFPTAILLEPIGQVEVARLSVTSPARLLC